jgi:hypothetical protein
MISLAVVAVLVAIFLAELASHVAAESAAGEIQAAIPSQGSTFHRIADSSLVCGGPDLLDQIKGRPCRLDGRRRAATPRQGEAHSLGNIRCRMLRITTSC